MHHCSPLTFSCLDSDTRGKETVCSEACWPAGLLARSFNHCSDTAAVSARASAARSAQSFAVSSAS